MAKIRGWKKGRDEKKIIIWSQEEGNGAVIFLRDSNIIEIERFSFDGLAIKEKYIYDIL